MMGAKETSPPEERPRPEDDPSEQARDRTQGRVSLPAGLDRVQVAARGSRHTRFTALLHHVDEAALLRAFQRQRRAASAGVDGMTAERYERDLERNIRDLCDRVHSGRYRPQPVRRTYIPKADGGRRPLGVSTHHQRTANCHHQQNADSSSTVAWDRLKITHPFHSIARRGGSSVLKVRHFRLGESRDTATLDRRRGLGSFAIAPVNGT